MKRAHLLMHFSAPVLCAVSALLVALYREPITGEVLFTHVFWGLLFYPAPHLSWAVVAAILKPALKVWHAGFAVSSCALAFIVAMSIWGPRDPSGLPYQWFLYWPLAGLLLSVVFVGWLLLGRPHAST